jgi:hypothetical protein
MLLPIEDFQVLVEPLKGLPVSWPWKGFGSSIFLELGELYFDETGVRGGRKRGQACIWINWDWRIESERVVLYGSSMSGPKIERGIGTLAGTILRSVSLVGEVPELLLSFSNGVRLRSTVMTTGDPQWSIKLPNDKYLSAKCGVLCLDDGESDAEAEHEDASSVDEECAQRWGVPRMEPAGGDCCNCTRFIRVDGEGYLLDYGVCAEATSPFDGKAVNCRSGCGAFTAG